MRSKLGFVVAASAALLFGTAGLAQADVITNRLASQHDNLCLTANGTQVQLSSCGDVNSQKWTVDTNARTIRSVGTGGCLGADLSTPSHNGTQIQLSACDGGNSQQWGFEDGSYLLYNIGGARCLEENGTQVRFWDCDSSKDTEQWASV